MDIDGYLFGSGFALLVVLLGWANQLTTRNKETKDLEAEFLKKARLRKQAYKKIAEKAGSSEESFLGLVDFIFTSEHDNVELFAAIQVVKTDLKSLEKKYNRRFWLLVALSIVLFLSGVISLFTIPEKKFWLMLPSLVLTGVVFYNLIDVYNLEKQYTKTLNEAMEKL